jgi:glycosyltransferase involved in cell wall biosynthesis
LNEAHVLETSIARLRDFCSGHLPWSWRVVIAENGSSDETAVIAQRLAARHADVGVVLIETPGRGRALREAWLRSRATVVGYMDVDLSTSLEDIPTLFGAILADGFDIAVGSRRLPASRVTRSWRRQWLSDGYNVLLRAALGVRFTDAQTGFKAFRREVAHTLLPLALDDSWFLDTELLVLAERHGYRIADLPVAWVEDDDSRVRIVQTALDDLRGIRRLRRTLGGRP